MKAKKDCNIERINQLALIASEIAIENYIEGRLSTNIYMQLVTALAEADIIAFQSDLFDEENKANKPSKKTKKNKIKN